MCFRKCEADYIHVQLLFCIEVKEFIYSTRLVLYEPRHEISNNVVYATSKGSLLVKLLTEQHLKFLSLKRGCTDSSEYTLVKLPHCWKLHVTAQLSINDFSLPASKVFILSFKSVVVVLRSDIL